MAPQIGVAPTWHGQPCPACECDLKKLALEFDAIRAEERAKAGKLAEALREVAKGEGKFNRDPFTFAENTIENMKEIAQAALAAWEGAQHG